MCGCVVECVGVCTCVNVKVLASFRYFCMYIRNLLYFKYV